MGASESSAKGPTPSSFYSILDVCTGLEDNFDIDKMGERGWLVSRALSMYQRVVSKWYFPMSKHAENRTIYSVNQGHHLSTVCFYVHMSLRN